MPPAGLNCGFAEPATVTIGRSDEDGRAIATDAGGAVYVTGSTTSTDFRVTGAIQGRAGSDDPSLGKILGGALGGGIGLAAGGAISRKQKTKQVYIAP